MSQVDIEQIKMPATTIISTSSAVSGSIVTTPPHTTTATVSSGPESILKDTSTTAQSRHEEKSITAPTSSKPKLGALKSSATFKYVFNYFKKYNSVIDL